MFSKDQQMKLLRHRIKDLLIEASILQQWRHMGVTTSKILCNLTFFYHFVQVDNKETNVM